MTFEEEKLALALATLRATEKRCMSDVTTIPPTSNQNSWAVPSFSNLQQSVKSRFWGGFSHSASSQNLCSSNNNGLNATAEQMVSHALTEIIPNAYKNKQGQHNTHNFNTHKQHKQTLHNTKQFNYC